MVPVPVARVARVVRLAHMDPREGAAAALSGVLRLVVVVLAVAPVHLESSTSTATRFLQWLDPTN